MPQRTVQTGTYMGTKWLLGLRVGGSGGKGDLKWTGAAEVGLSGLRALSPVPLLGAV